MLQKAIGFALSLAVALCTSVAVRASGPAAAESSASKSATPEVKVGDQWKFACTDGGVKSERIWAVTSVEATGIKGTENGRPLAFTTDFNVLETPRFKISANKTLSFPLEVGKKWEFTDDYVNFDAARTQTFRGEGHEKYAISVDGYEKVRVSAGEFDAFKLTASESFADVAGATGTTDTVLWYAPAARIVVKFNSIVHAMRGMEHSCQLVEYLLQP